MQYLSCCRLDIDLGTWQWYWVDDRIKVNDPLSAAPVEKYDDDYYDDAIVKKRIGQQSIVKTTIAGDQAKVCNDEPADN